MSVIERATRSCVYVCVIEIGVRETFSNEDHTRDGRDVKDVIMKQKRVRLCHSLSKRELYL